MNMGSVVLKSVAAVAAAIVIFTVMPSSRVDAEAADLRVYLGGYVVTIELYSDGPAVSAAEKLSRSRNRENTALTAGARGSIDGNGTLAGRCGKCGQANGENAAYSSAVRKDPEISFKDGLSGLGTVTFELSDGTYRALGHAIAGDDGKDYAAAYGYIYEAAVIGAKLPSEAGAGRLIGKRAENEPVGNVLENDIFGLRGELFRAAKGEECEVLRHDEVKLGKAVIYSTVGREKCAYDIEIVKASRKNAPSEKGMVIKVTDEELLRTTGGILQGMSGSPIVQDGKLAGAITHVFTGDPTRGYGVFAEWMI